MSRQDIDGKVDRVMYFRSFSVVPTSEVLPVHAFCIEAGKKAAQIQHPAHALKP